MTEADTAFVVEVAVAVASEAEAAYTLAEVGKKAAIFVVRTVEVPEGVVDSKDQGVDNSRRDGEVATVVVEDGDMRDSLDVAVNAEADSVVGRV